jgi:hypothetical protein
MKVFAAQVMPMICYGTCATNTLSLSIIAHENEQQHLQELAELELQNKKLSFFDFFAKVLYCSYIDTTTLRE